MSRVVKWYKGIERKLEQLCCEHDKGLKEDIVHVAIRDFKNHSVLYLKSEYTCNICGQKIEGPYKAHKINKRSDNSVRLFRVVGLCDIRDTE